MGVVGLPPWNKGKFKTHCKWGHSDWIVDRSGQRRCRTCRNQSRPPGSKKKWTDRTISMGKGPREETFSRSEIMKARGYV